MYVLVRNTQVLEKTLSCHIQNSYSSCLACATDIYMYVSYYPMLNC